MDLQWEDVDEMPTYSRPIKIKGKKRVVCSRWTL